VDETKRGRDLGAYLRQRVAQAFREGENTQVTGEEAVGGRGGKDEAGTGSKSGLEAGLRTRDLLFQPARVRGPRHPPEAARARRPLLLLSFLTWLHLGIPKETC
jgi:hypothetical protein